MPKIDKSHGEPAKSRHNHVAPKADQIFSLALVIFAKDEERNIRGILESVAAQTLCARHDINLSVEVVANGCTDRTAEIAREWSASSTHVLGKRAQIHDWPTPGKSRSWNRVVHDVFPDNLDYVIAMDADIEFVSDTVLSEMFELMRGAITSKVLSGSPIKDIVRKSRPNLVDRFSTKISDIACYADAICGQLYLAKAQCLKEIWLPDETPGEDGFLNAMVRTRGFSQSPRPDAVMQMSSATHYYESHSVAAFFAHEKRMIVGTMINRWIFEYLMSLRLTEPAGKLIDSLNRERPDWVDKIIEKQSSSIWLIPGDLLFRRLAPRNGATLSYLLHLPALMFATVLTVLPALTANRALKKRGAASLW